MAPGTDLLGVLTVVAVIALALLASFARTMHFGRASGADGPDPDEKTNCPACGARVVADRADCSYCGESLGDDAGARRDVTGGS